MVRRSGSGLALFRLLFSLSGLPPPSEVIKSAGEEASGRLARRTRTDILLCKLTTCVELDRCTVLFECSEERGEFQGKLTVCSSSDFFQFVLIFARSPDLSPGVLSLGYLPSFMQGVF